jgi:hypothetical protein
MNKFINNHRFMQQLFDDKNTAKQAAEIGDALMEARSLRLTDIAVQMSGKSAAGYKRIQRFLKSADPREALWRLFQENAEFVIGDPTEIERPQAWKTAYVGTLKDGKTKGFWALVLATPHRGRAIPCGFVTYSSKTIATQADSRNSNHFRAFEELKDMLGERPLVLDREFSYLELLLNLVEEQVNFVIRLNLGSNPPKFLDSDGQEVALTISPGETVIHNGVWYKGQVRVNLIGTWKKGFSTSLWVMTNLEAKIGQRIYFARMKIEESFRDLKNLLGMTKLMNKQQAYMEKMLALLLLTFAIGLLIGEGIRDLLYGELIAEDEPVPDRDRIPGSPNRKKGKKWKRYSGLFVLLKQKFSMSSADRRIILDNAFAAFTALVQHPVLTHV